jgi:hypothetical protein
VSALRGVRPPRAVIVGLYDVKPPLKFICYACLDR